MKSVFSTRPVKGCDPSVCGKRGFTVTELLVVIATVAVLALALLPVLARDRAEPQGTQCYNNFRQLSAAWLMYADDNHDYCPGNEFGSPGGEQDWPAYKGKYTRSGITPCTNWVSGWIDPTGNSGNFDNTSVIGMTSESDNTNWDLLVDPSYASMGEYTKNPLLYVCPACDVMVDSSPGGPKTNPTIRTVSMNNWLGFITSQIPVITGLGTYKPYSKITAIAAGAKPAGIFVFIEERAESIDDGSFETEENENTTIANYPANYHNGAASVGFADGHVEVHRWVGETTGQGYSFTVPQAAIVTAKWNFGTVVGNLSDLDWLQAHAACLQ